MSTGTATSAPILHQKIFAFCKQLDQLEWVLDDTLAGHGASPQFLELTEQKVKACYAKYSKKICLKIPRQSDRQLLNAHTHFLQKRKNLALKVTALMWDLEIFAFCKQLDQLEWALEDAIEGHCIPIPFLEQTQQKVEACYAEYAKATLLKIPKELESEFLKAHSHFLQKKNNLVLKAETLLTLLLHQKIFAFCKRLDQLEWALENALTDRCASPQFLELTQQKVKTCYAKYSKKISLKIPRESESELLNAHMQFLRKQENLVLKVTGLLWHPRILTFCKQLDKLEWALDDQLQDHPVSSQFLEGIQKNVWACYSEYIMTIYPKIRPGSHPELSSADRHFLQKHEHLRFKIVALAPIKPVLDQQEFVQKSHFKPPSLATKDTSSVNPLVQISSCLREERDDEAIGLVCGLPIALQKNIFDALHLVKGSPSPEDPIGHVNFGEISFKNKEPRCASNPQQKACAVELVNLSTGLFNLIVLLRERGTTPFKDAFTVLPECIKNEIFKKHWEQMGKPTFNSPQEALRKIAHHDFGRVSLLALESRCDVIAAYKIKTLEAYLVDFHQKIVAAQSLMQQVREGWNKMENLSGEEKDSIKKKNLQDLAGAIVPLFEGPVKEIKVEGTYHALGTAYVKVHPCLRPFFLQLMNYLEM